MFSQERKYGRLPADVSHQQPRQPPHHASLRGHHSNHSLAHFSFTSCDSLLLYRVDPIYK